MSIAFSGFTHASTLVRWVTGIAAFSAVGMFYLVLGHEHYPGLRGATPFVPWALVAGIGSVLTTLVPWFRSPALAAMAVFVSLGVILVLAMASFRFSPVLWLNVVSVVLVVRWYVGRTKPSPGG